MPLVRFFLALFLSSALCVHAPSARAAPADCDLQNDPCADEVVVSASRAPRRAEEIGSSVSIIDAAEIEAGQYSFAADALRHAVGVSLARNGGAGAASSVRLRGAASGQTLVVIDGVAMNDPAAPQGGYNFANLDVADIARIEVLRGPQGIAYGADAIGGVISIVTKDVSGDRAAFRLEGGSLGTARGGATLFAGDAAAFARATLSGARSNGISRADGGTENDAYRTLAASIKAGAAFGGAWSGKISARTSRSRAEIDGFPAPAFSLADTLEDETTRDYGVALQLLHEHTNVDGEFSFTYSAIDRRNRDRGAPAFAAEGRRARAGYLADIAVSKRIKLIAGTEIERASAEVSGVDDASTSGAVFALLEVSPAETLHLAAGARRDEFSDFEGATTARISASWELGDDFLLRASWGEGFRAPSPFELHFDQFGVIPNPDLQPERAHGYDAGVEWRRGSTLLRATLFETRTRDLIDFSFPQSGYFNVSRARARGVEAEAEIVADERWRLALGYTLTDAVNRDTGGRLPRIPSHKGVATATFLPTERWSLAASLSANGREDDFPAPNPAFVRLDLRAAYGLSDAVELTARVENATDADYQDVSGYGEPGASFFAGARVRL